MKFKLDPALFLIPFTVLWMVAFPKGGIVLANIPITWGYITLGFAGLMGLYLTLRRFGKLPIPNLVALVSLLPVQAFSLAAIFGVGVGSLGAAVAHLVNVIVLPFIFLFCFTPVYQSSRLLLIVLRTFRWCVVFASFYGIALFVYFYMTHSYFEIPFVTVNGMQEVGLEQKMNVRGDFSKLISTYNNGNIYAICMLTVLPIYQQVEKISLFRLIIKVSILLTLSRTAWAGLLAFEILNALCINKERFKRVFFMGLTGGFLLLGVMFFLESMNRDISWLFDATLGGRTEKLSMLEYVGWFPAFLFQNAGEIVYLAVLLQLGIGGLLAFILGFTSPLWVRFIFRRQLIVNPLRTAGMIGVALYLLVAFADGAFLYAPCVAFFWFSAGLVFIGNDAARDVEECGYFRKKRWFRLKRATKARGAVNVANAT